MMSRLDDLLIKAKEFASVAGNKAQEVAELTRLRLQAAQLRSDLDSNYLKMGEIIYELKKANTENQDLIDMCIAEIDAQQQELEELNEKIDTLRKEVKCPECMASNPREALYCSRCGAALLAAKQPVQEEAPETDASVNDQEEAPAAPETAPQQESEKPVE